MQGPFNSATVTKVGTADSSSRTALHAGAAPAHAAPDSPPRALSRPPPRLQSDVPACKSLITLIDAVLLPFNPASPPPADYLAPAAELGAQGCAVAPNALITGQEAKAGDANRQVGRAGVARVPPRPGLALLPLGACLAPRRSAARPPAPPLPLASQPTIGACCASCAATSGCNAWRYCSQKAGCRIPDRTLLKYGHCALLRSGEIAAGQPAIYEVSSGRGAKGVGTQAAGDAAPCTALHCTALHCTARPACRLPTPAHAARYPQPPPPKTGLVRRHRAARQRLHCLSPGSLGWRHPACGGRPRPARCRASGGGSRRPARGRAPPVSVRAPASRQRASGPPGAVVRVLARALDARRAAGPAPALCSLPAQWAGAGARLGVQCRTRRLPCALPPNLPLLHLCCCHAPLATPFSDPLP